MPKIHQSTEEVLIDINGKTVSKRTNKILSWGDEPPFVKMYLDSLLYLKDLPKGHNNILMEFLKHMTYAGEENGQIIFVNSTMKKIIAKNLDVSVSRVDNVLSDLTKGQLFFRIDRGTFRVNPNFFGKGDWQDIARLRLEVTFDSKGKTIMGVIEKKTQKEKEEKEEDEASH